MYRLDLQIKADRLESKRKETLSVCGCMGAKLLSGIKSMYVDCPACVKVKGGESEWFRIDSRVRQGCIMSP